MTRKYDENLHDARGARAIQGDTGSAQFIAGWHRKSQANDLPSRSRYLQCEADARYRTDSWTNTYDYKNLPLDGIEYHR